MHREPRTCTVYTSRFSFLVHASKDVARHPQTMQRCTRIACVFSCDAFSPRYASSQRLRRDASRLPSSSLICRPLFFFAYFASRLRWFLSHPWRITRPPVFFKFFSLPWLLRGSRGENSAQTASSKKRAHACHRTKSTRNSARVKPSRMGNSGGGARKTNDRRCKRLAQSWNGIPGIETSDAVFPTLDTVQ